MHTYLLLATAQRTHVHTIGIYIDMEVHKVCDIKPKQHDTLRYIFVVCLKMLTKLLVFLCEYAWVVFYFYVVNLHAN